MLDVLAIARPVYDPALQTLTVDVPATATKGDLLLLAVVYTGSSGLVVPDGYTDLGAVTVSGVTIRSLARMVDGEEKASLVVDLTAGGDEVQGTLVLLGGAGSLPLLIEASASLAFVATLAPGSPAVSSLQAIDLVLEVWSSSGALVMAGPAGSDARDTYSTALITARTLLVCSRRANATGALALGAASSNANATGSAFALVLRDGLPKTPIELFDDVPGNIGLLGKDVRPAREAT
jgi:hypothetical protein